MESSPVSYPCLQLSGRHEELEIASVVLFEAGCLGTDEVDSSTFRAYFPPGSNLSNLHLRLVDDFPTLSSVVVESLPDKDWLSTWKKELHGFSLGRKFFVLPSWEEAPSTPRTVVHIDPERAFGTGTHDTTRLSVELIEDFARAGDSVIDAGSGTGVLSIAAALLGCRPIDAIEIDPDAAACLRANILRNQLARVVRVHQCSISDANLNLADLVLANLNIGILRDSWTQISKWLRVGGLLIASGLLLEQTDGFLEALPPGQRLVEHRTAGDWAALLIQKTSDA